VPDDGPHTARLERAKLIETANGTRLVTEWSENGVWWTSWNRFDEQGMQWTQGLLDGLGVDREKIADRADDDYTNEQLAGVVGVTYSVTCKSQQGRQGDRWFTTTYVDGPAVPLQSELGEEPVTVPAAQDDDTDDVPF
jgi:hypothetical protein